jgi:ABC-2 family transporter
VIAFSWRQFRLQALIGAAGLAVLGAILLITGPNIVHLYDAAAAQCPVSSDGCTNPAATADGKLQVFVLGLVLVVPVLIGMFWGAPLVARELETGTFRLAWTQSVSRMRWLLVKLGLVGLASAVVGVLLSLMVSWWFSPIDAFDANRFSPAAFGMHGFVPGGYALFAFALGATMGLLFRRTLPAMVVTLVGFIAARVVVAEWIRPRFMSPVTDMVRLNPNSGWGITLNGSAVSVSADPPALPNALVVSNTIVNDQGQSPSNSFLQKACPNLPGVNGAQPSGGGGASHVGASPGGQQAFQQCVDAVAAKYHQVVTYQPAGRFWAFQTYETLLFVVLAAALTGVSVWWVRRRLN